ncbi:MAG: HAMP domain-containing histidine kinase [Lachnospiraceae bacterium]|nr:HAMP domain-containing histidine kinase [Lachnospiraceae bacterium]
MDVYISVLLLIAFIVVMLITVLHGSYMKKQSRAHTRQMLISLAHDIGTPLTVIRGYAEGLLDGVADTREKQVAYLKLIYGKAMEMDALLSDMMLYTRAYDQSISYEKKPFDVGEAIESYLDATAVDHEIRNARLEFSDETGTEVFVDGDPAQLRRVLDNLVENSIKYKRGDSCHIRLRLYLEGDEVILTVTDDGRGIQADELPFVFDDMYRGGEKRGSIRGNGVGLWLVKRIITDHGGRVWAESEYGEWTTIGMALTGGRYGEDTDN